MIFRLLETFCNIKNRPIPGYDEKQRQQNKIFIYISTTQKKIEIGTMRNLKFVISKHRKGRENWQISPQEKIIQLMVEIKVI